jgi:SPP1 gp7 family putative phage head morphogenesis protein
MQQKGWWGQQEMRDPITGETRTVQLGSPRRLQTIFDVNLSTSYAAGAWKKISDNSKNQPYLMYNAVDDSRTRPLHRSWDNKVLRWDNPWWNTHYPPNGWRCRCTVIALSDADLKDMGKDGPDEDPDVKTKTWTNPRTGSVEQIPEGIDPGWAYNVGQNYLQQLTQQFLEKAAIAPANLGAAAFRQLSNEVLDAVEKQFGAWVDETYALGVSSRRFAVAGVLAPEDVAFLETQDISPVNAGIVIEDRLLVSKKATRHREDGDALTPEEWKALPAALTVPETVLWDVANKTLLYIFPAQDKKGKLAVQVARSEKKVGVVNLAKSGYKQNTKDIEDRINLNKRDSERGYKPIRGELQK